MLNIDKFHELFRWRQYEPSQNYFELWTLIKYLEVYFEKNINSGIEVGTFHDGTLRFFAEILNEDGFFISVDLNDRGFIPDLIKEYVNDDRVNFIIGDSTAEETLRLTEARLQDRKVDFVFIDGNHQEKYVTADFENYSKYVRRNGLIIFHDIVGEELNACWVKFREGKKYIEIYGDVNPCGMGVIINE